MNTSEAIFPPAEAIFSNYAPFGHLWTPENHEVILSDEGTFHAGMNIFAIAVVCSPDVRIVTFELMSNHLHVTLSSRDTSGGKADRLTFSHSSAASAG